MTNAAHRATPATSAWEEPHRKPMRPPTAAPRRWDAQKVAAVALCAVALAGGAYFVMTANRANASFATESEAGALLVASSLAAPPLTAPLPAPVPAAAGSTPLPPVASPAPPAASRVSAPPATGSLEFQVVDATTRQPLADARAAVVLATEASGADPRGWRTLPSFKAATVQAGKAVISGLRAGEYFYALTVNGGRPTTGRVWVGTVKASQFVAVERRQADNQRGADLRRSGRQGRQGRNGMPPGGQRPRGRNPGGAEGDPGGQGDEGGAGNRRRGG